MLIESYELEISITTHSTEHFEYEAIALLNVDIHEVLPYLNATLSRGIYSHGRQLLPGGTMATTLASGRTALPPMIWTVERRVSSQ